MSSKGQIVIPSALREKLNIKTGTRLAVRSENNQLVLQPITKEFISSLAGCCKGEDSLVETRERDHRIEKIRTLKK
ncbi:MAG TPA: AbrB/MazE/SpoVT family DNA-binding domain-containing protein [Terriglobales bacterium]|nr:AbrB/MazE/SpoVT family DNA-binding domain-containing protein [Terriglobales bacterium]